MASNPPGQCCIVGVKHEGEAKGSMGKVGNCKCTVSRSSFSFDLIDAFLADDAYFATPEDKNTKYGVVLFPDFMGYELINAKL